MGPNQVPYSNHQYNNHYNARIGGPPGSGGAMGPGGTMGPGMGPGMQPGGAGGGPMKMNPYAAARARNAPYPHHPQSYMYSKRFPNQVRIH